MSNANHDQRAVRQLRHLFDSTGFGEPIPLATAAPRTTACAFTTNTPHTGTYHMVMDDA
jgi:hypothetical protein